MAIEKMNENTMLMMIIIFVSVWYGLWCVAPLLPDIECDVVLCGYILRVTEIHTIKKQRPIDVKHVSLQSVLDRPQELDN